MEVYQKLNPTCLSETTEFNVIEQAKTSSNEEMSEMFIVNEIPADDEEFLESSVKSYSDGEEYKDVYFELEEQEQEQEQEKVDEAHLKQEQSADEASTPRLQNQSSPKEKQKNRMNRKSYTVEKKLEIIDYAEKHNNRVAARLFAMNESTVRCFRRQKDLLLSMSPLKKTNRKAFPHWPELESELREFVINHPHVHGAKAKLKEIKKEAIDIAAKHGIENFNGSNSYIFKFMQRHQLPSASPRPRKNRKPGNEPVKKSV